MYNFNNHLGASNTAPCTIEASVNQNNDSEGDKYHYVYGRFLHHFIENQAILTLRTSQPYMEHLVVRMDLKPERIQEEKHENCTPKPPSPVTRLRKLWQAYF